MHCNVYNQLVVTYDHKNSRNSSSPAKSACGIPDQVDSRTLIFKDFICIVALGGENTDLFFNIPNSLNSKAAG